MHIIRCSARHAWPLALAFASMPALASGDALPEPRTLIDRHLDAIGGVEAVRNSGDGTVRIALEIEENGMRGSMLMHSRGKDMVLVMRMAGMEMRMGEVGGVAWSIDPMHGPRLIEGEELSDQQNRTDPDVATYADASIASMKTVGLADSEGRPCYRVEIAWKSGDDTVDCFGVEEHFLLSSQSTGTSPMGDMRQTMHFYDYKPYGDFRMPTRMRMKVAGITQIMIVESVEMATPPDEAFALPPAIVALLDEAEASEPGRPAGAQEPATSPAERP